MADARDRQPDEGHRHAPSAEDDGMLTIAHDTSVSSGSVRR
jgi:hypothetical protein